MKCWSSSLSLPPVSIPERIKLKLELQHDMTLLAIETSCDETSAAVVRDGRSSVQRRFLANQTARRIRRRRAGTRRARTSAESDSRRPKPRLQRSAGCSADQLDAVAATQGPGLPTALLVGFKAAQAVAFALRKPFVGIHHHEAHLVFAVDFRRIRPSADFLPPFNPTSRSSSAADTRCWCSWNRN